MMQHIKKALKDKVAEEAKRVAKKVFRDEVEAAKVQEVNPHAQCRQMGGRRPDHAGLQPS
jgi:hypothetical protein